MVKVETFCGVLRATAVSLELWLWYCGLWKFYDFALLYSWLGRKWKRSFYTLKLAKYYMQQNMPRM
ncbi:unnamed protein product [Callosobruchus maculatus]|uniref:Uncharacterized protein n=1 Tax=Callosobruchus maculatus TaxID=64391 RepID=A0A653D075_CALMS|nr:unnamed protein product [Callosobruchus maculatus]